VVGRESGAAREAAVPQRSLSVLTIRSDRIFVGESPFGDVNAGGDVGARDTGEIGDVGSDAKGESLADGDWQVLSLLRRGSGAVRFLLGE